mmetsp:Transcript_95112/g.188415  ORF Transcript_95112/g.188415 Transcript_95112/m.188415 type:complete len:320 (+) Transcript_95112:56-1015(+)
MPKSEVCSLSLSRETLQRKGDTKCSDVAVANTDSCMINGCALLFTIGRGQPPQPPLLVLIPFLPARGFACLTQSNFGMYSIMKGFGVSLISERHKTRLQAWCPERILQEAARVEEACCFESFAEESQLQWIDHAPIPYAKVEHVKGPDGMTLRAMMIGPPGLLTLYPQHQMVSCLSQLIRPNEISWLVCSANTSGSGGARICCVTFAQHAAVEAIRMYFKNGHLWWEVAENAPIPLKLDFEPDRWHRITCALDWVSKTSNVQIEPLGPAGVATVCPRLGFHSSGCDGIGSISLGSVVCGGNFPKGCRAHVSDISLRLVG